ncbi:MAG: GNAT family N-acetyltransferase [Alphaproteobacteria bacterium]|nr:GNAT family N-acetyltransferase [Alphaproteobacteria bacterium]
MFDLNAIAPLETERLLLRGWRDADAAPFAAMMAQPDVARFLTADQRPQDPAAAWRTLSAFVGHWALRGYGLFVVEEKATGAFVGRAGLWNPEGWAGLELGWGLDRRYWGRGYATEAARAAARWAFEALRPERLISLIHVDNAASQNVAMRLGEKPGVATLHAGMPHVIWAVTKTDWLKANPPP